MISFLNPKWEAEEKLSGLSLPLNQSHTPFLSGTYSWDQENRSLTGFRNSNSNFCPQSIGTGKRLKQPTSSTSYLCSVQGQQAQRSHHYRWAQLSHCAKRESPWSSLPGLTLDMSMVGKERWKISSLSPFFSGFLNNYFDQKSYFGCQKLIFNPSFINSCFNNPNPTLHIPLSGK